MAAVLYIIMVVMNNKTSHMGIHARGHYRIVEVMNNLTYV